MPGLSIPRQALLIIAGLVLLVANEARAVGVDCITENVAAQCVVGEAQLSVTFSSPNASQIRFDVANTGAIASSVAGVYIDDTGFLDSLASIVNGTGVSFAADGSPPDLPGGNDVDPAFVADFRANAANPAPTNGVNPGETLGLIFNLATGISVAEAQAAFADGSLRVGLHVISILGAGSESFVAVPEPSVGLLVGAGLAGLAVARRRGRTASRV